MRTLRTALLSIAPLRTASLYTALLLLALTFCPPGAFAEAPQTPQAVQTPEAPQTSQAPQAPASTPPHYSADGLYNLANSYARAGKPGLAVLNYERAALLAPNDPDIATNLETVRAAAHVPSEPRTRFSRYAQLVTPTTAAWLGVLGIALAGVALLAKRAPKRLRWMRAWGVLIGAALLSVTICNAVMLWPRMNDAVILVKQTSARVTPVPMADTAFVLREAETVTVTAEHEDFLLIRTRTGQSGWVSRADLGTVAP